MNPNAEKTNKQNSYKVTIGTTEYTKHVPMPIKWESLLDERLDSARLTVKHTKEAVFEPLTEVKIEITDKLNKKLDKTWVVSADSSSEVPVGSGFYNHELILVEETKKLESIIIEPLTYTNDLGRDYAIEGYFAPYIATFYNRMDTDGSQFTAEYSVKPFLVPISENGETNLPSINEIITPWPMIVPDSKATVTAECGEKKWYLVDGKAVDVRGIHPSFTVKFSGYWKIVYSFRAAREDGSGVVEYDAKITFDVPVVRNVKPLPKWNITSVINRLLDLAEPHLKKDETKPRYKLNDNQAEEFAKIESPEFAFSKMTLKEALDQIGGFIHGVPRLKGNEIYFDMLGGTEQAKLADPKYPCISNQLSQDIENYATKLDSTVDNLVNMIDSDEGVIVEPYSGGFKSVRTEDTYAAITESGMIIPTSFPIYDVRKLEFGGYDGKGEGKPLTAYVFEAADYGTMSSYEELYPASKAYAIYYTQGEKNIKGLGFKVPDATAPAFKKYAIVNVIKAATGVDVDGSNYFKLKFRITYTPIFSSRVEQHKFYYKDLLPRTLAYNQSANLIETRFYGENLKGTIARMGNTEVTRTYRLNSMSLIPEIGQAWGDDYFVSAVTVAMYPFYFDCTVGLTKDYNRLSQYIGINSQKRTFEVSEKQAYNRDMRYSDYVVISNKKDKDLSGEEFLNDSSGINCLGDEVMYAIKNTFLQDKNQTFGKNSPTLAIVKTFDDPFESTETTTANNMLAMPVVSTAMGNAMVFSFFMDNNYSAGEKSVKENDEKYWQTNTRYCDYYGRFDYMSVTFHSYGTGNDEAPFELPQADGTTPSVHLIIATAPNNPLVVRKNNTEIIRFNYNVHFVTDIKGLIIGPALTHNCPLVRGLREEHTAELYVLPRRIGKFDRFVDRKSLDSDDDLKPEYDFTDNKIQKISQYAIKLNNAKAKVNGLAWAIVDKKSGELLIGKNIPITAGDDIELPVLYLKHDLYK